MARSAAEGEAVEGEMEEQASSLHMGAGRSEQQGRFPRRSWTGRALWAHASKRTTSLLASGRPLPSVSALAALLSVLSPSATVALPAASERERERSQRHSRSLGRPSVLLVTGVRTRGPPSRPILTHASDGVRLPQVPPHMLTIAFSLPFSTFVNKHPQRLHCFYTKNSTFIHGTEGEDGVPCTGQQVRLRSSRATL